MDCIAETVLEVAVELISEGIDAAITARQEKKRKAASRQADAELIIKKGEKTDVCEKLNH